MTRIVYRFPAPNPRSLELEAIDVTNPGVVAQAPYQLTHSTLLFQRIPFAGLNREQLADLRDAIDRELYDKCQGHRMGPLCHCCGRGHTNNGETG